MSRKEERREEREEVIVDIFFFCFWLFGGFGRGVWARV